MAQFKRATGKEITVAIKFGGKQSMTDKMKVAESRVGKNPGASKGTKPAPPAKVKPIIGKDKVGIKVTKKI